MKGRVIALDTLKGRAAAALIVDGRLEDFAIDPRDDAPPQPGAIFRATVGRAVKGQGGVFVALPGGARGFLRQVSGLAPGQKVLAQVSGHAEAGKAVPLTLRLLFKSRYAIVTPDAPGMNISRRIRGEALRTRLSALAGEAMEGAREGLGLIVRSAAESAGEGSVVEDIARTRALAEAILADTAGAPELLLDGPGAQDIAWRDWTDPAPDEVADHGGSFAALGVDEMLDAALAPEVELPAGASMVVEPTRALIAIDINTGPDTTPAAGLKANIAAARDLPRQLRLRGLGGQVVVDFAPMPKRDRATLEQVLKAAFRHEAAETSLAGWTPLGNYELQRKRDRMPLHEALA